MHLYINNNNNNNNKFINKIDIRKIYKDKKYRIMIILSLLVAIILANKAKGNQLLKYINTNKAYVVTKRDFTIRNYFPTITIIL